MPDSPTRKPREHSSIPRSISTACIASQWPAPQSPDREERTLVQSSPSQSLWPLFHHHYSTRSAPCITPGVLYPCQAQIPTSIPCTASHPFCCFSFRQSPPPSWPPHLPTISPAGEAAGWTQNNQNSWFSVQLSVKLYFPCTRSPELGLLLLCLAHPLFPSFLPRWSQVALC